jgi:hypothetical protein
LNRLADRVAELIVARLEPPVRTKRLFTLGETAEYLGRSVDGVKHLLALGAFPALRSDRRVFVDVVDLDSWIEQNKTRGIV